MSCEKYCLFCEGTKANQPASAVCSITVIFKICICGFLNAYVHVVIF